MNSHSGCQRKLTHTLHSFPRSTTAFLASLSLIPEKKNCLMAGHAVAFVSPSDAACIKCSRPLPANDSVMGASLNVLSMLCGSNIVARGAAPALCKSALPGYTSAQVLKTPSTADSRPDSLRLFLRPLVLRYESMGGRAANTIPACREYARRLLTVFISCPPPAENRVLSLVNRSKTMAHKAGIPSSAPAPETNPELINAYQLNGIDNKLDDVYQYFRYVSKQVFRNAIKREICAGMKVAQLIDLPAKDVPRVMQWLDSLRNEAIRNWVATQSLEQRFLNQWLENSRKADQQFSGLKPENPAQEMAA